MTSALFMGRNVHDWTGAPHTLYLAIGLTKPLFSVPSKQLLARALQRLCGAEVKGKFGVLLKFNTEQNV